MRPGYNQERVFLDFLPPDPDHDPTRVGKILIYVNSDYQYREIIDRDPETESLIILIVVVVN